jgi:hypothetical protein
VQPADVGTDGVYLGTTLNPVISLLKHSCEPNVFIFFEGNQLRVRSVKPLQAGEEMSRSYTWTEDSYFARQRDLLLQRDFRCDCQCYVICQYVRSKANFYRS